jgi:hypothetical protein
MEKTDRTVRELWWEDNDLHIVYDDDGKEVIFKGAYVTGCNFGDGDDNTIVTKYILEE